MNGAQSVDPAHSVGCAAVVVMVTPNKVICANAGGEKRMEKQTKHTYSKVVAIHLWNTPLKPFFAKQPVEIPSD